MTQEKLDKKLAGAVENGNLYKVKEYLNQGADIHACDDYALRSAALTGHLDVMKYLVEQGADIHARNDEALKWAKKYHHYNIVRYLRMVSYHTYISKKYYQPIKFSAKNL